MSDHDDEIKQLAPDTPADTLHAHVENHIKLPDAAKFDNEPLMNELTAHPNLGSHSIHKLYQHMMEGTSQDLTSKGHAEPYSNEWAGNLLRHPNAPTEIKRDFALKTFHPDNPSSDLHEEMANSGVLSDDELRGLADNVLASGKTPHGYSQLPASYYLNHFKKASQTDPESDPDDKLGLVKKGRFAWRGLLNSKKHTPETLDSVIEAASNNKYLKHQDSYHDEDVVHTSPYLSDLVESRKDLSKDQLNRIHQTLSGSSEDHWRKRDAVDKILEHPNVDPSLLAKYAVGKDVRSEALKNPNLPNESINAFIKRAKDSSDYTEKQHVDALLENPKITPTHVKALAAKGFRAAIKHPMADENDVRNLWNASDKGAETARDLLTAKNVPPDVLKEMVNHKNQDVAVSALKHSKADMDVVQEGLKRKAKGVQDEARLHPLVAGEQVKEGLKSGKTSLHKVYEDPDFQKHFDAMPKMDQEEIFKQAHSKYSGTDLDAVAKTSKERPENVLYGKFQLANDERVPQEIREKNSKDLVRMFDDKVGKNKELNFKVGHILDDDVSTEDGLIKAVTDLADSGDKNAQAAVLKNPAILHNAHAHLDFENADPKFLEDIYNKSRDYARQNKKIYDREGRPQDFDARGHVMDNLLLGAKNTPIDVFHKIATDPKVMEQVGVTDSFKRYDSLPEAEQNQRYAEILEGKSPAAAESIIKTKAPAQSWDAALNSLSPEAKDSALELNIEHVKAHRPDVFHNAIMGLYNPEGERAESQAAAVKILDPQSVQDKNSLKQLMSQNNGSLPGYMDDADIVDAIPEEMITQHPDLIEHAAASGRNQMAHSMLRVKLNNDVSSLRSPSRLSDPHEIAQNTAKAQGVLAEINQRAQTMRPPGGEAENPVAANLSSMMHADDAFPKLKEAGINLDFLADQPGAEGKTLREEALKNDLISPDKIAQVAQAGNLNDAIAMEGIRAQPMLEAALTSPNIKSHDLIGLGNKLNHGHLNPEAFEGGRRSAMSDEAYQTYSNRLNKMFDLYTVKAPHSIESLVRGALRSIPSTNRGYYGRGSSDNSLTVKDVERISSGLMEHIDSLPWQTPTARNDAALSVINGISYSNANVANKLRNQLEKKIFNDKDYSTAIRMADIEGDGGLSDAGLAKLAKAAAKPELLTVDQLAGISKQLGSQSSADAVVSMARTFDNKVAEAQAAGKDMTVHKVQFMNNLSATFTSYPHSEEDKVKNDFVLNYTRKQALDPKTMQPANTNLFKMAVSMSTSDPEKAADQFASLPDSREAFQPNSALVGDIPSELSNSPRFMEMAQGGWKLGLLAHNAEDLTGANTSILVNRVMSAQPFDVDKVSLLDRLESNKFAQAEDSIKIGRSLSTEDFQRLVHGVSNSLRGNLTHIASARIKDLEAAAKDPNIAAPNAPFMGEEHRSHLLSNMRAMSDVIEKAKPEDRTANLGEKAGNVASMISAIHGHIKTMGAHMREQIKKTGNTTDIGKSQASIEAIASGISNTGLKLDRDDAIKTLDMVKEYHEIDRAIGQSRPEATYNTVGNIVARAENFESQDWKEMFNAAPDAVFHLAKRSEIPSEALDAIDTRMYEDHAAISEGSSVQKSFAQAASKWFEKMSDADQQTHGKKIMDSLMRMQSEGKIQSSVYKPSMIKAIDSMAKHMDHNDVNAMLARTKDGHDRQDLYKHAVQKGAGGRETLERFARDYEKTFGDALFRSDIKNFQRGSEAQIAQKLRPITESPHLTDDLAGQVSAQWVSNPQIMAHAMSDMLLNPRAPESAITRVSQNVLRQHKAGFSDISESESLDYMKQLMAHPNVKEKELMEMFDISNEKYPKYFAPESNFNPALQNPTHGGKLFRAMPVVVPENVPHVDQGKVTKSVNLKSKDYNRMKEIMGLIPAEGMTWVDFKRKFPAQEKNLPASVKDVFMKANNKPVMPEQFAQGMRELDNNDKKYHLTYSHWESDLQRHRDEKQKPNLVVQINNSAESEKELSADPKLWSLYQHLLQQANGISEGSIGLHPTTPHMVSWSRVDTDQGGSAWVIEEHQSDFAQKFRRNLKALMSNFPAGASINGHQITAAEMKKYAKTIDKHVEDWADASMQAVIDNAKAQGIKKLYMHGAELRGNMSNSNQYTREFWDNKNTQPQTVGFRQIYDETPRKAGFQQCDYTDYPNYSAERLNSLNKNKLSTKCWVLPLEEAAPKRRKRS